MTLRLPSRSTPPSHVQERCRAVLSTPPALSWRFWKTYLPSLVTSDTPGSLLHSTRASAQRPHAQLHSSAGQEPAACPSTLGSAGGEEAEAGAVRASTACAEQQLAATLDWHEATLLQAALLEPWAHQGVAATSANELAQKALQLASPQAQALFEACEGDSTEPEAVLAEAQQLSWQDRLCLGCAAVALDPPQLGQAAALLAALQGMTGGSSEPDGWRDRVDGSSETSVSRGDVNGNSEASGRSSRAGGSSASRGGAEGTAAEALQVQRAVGVGRGGVADEAPSALSLASCTAVLLVTVRRLHVATQGAAGGTLCRALLGELWTQVASNASTRRPISLAALFCTLVEVSDPSRPLPADVVTAILDALHIGTEQLHGLTLQNTAAAMLKLHLAAIMPALQASTAMSAGLSRRATTVAASSGGAGRTTSGGSGVVEQERVSLTNRAVYASALSSPTARIATGRGGSSISTTSTSNPTASDGAAQRMSLPMEVHGAVVAVAEASQCLLQRLAEQAGVAEPLPSLQTLAVLAEGLLTWRSMVPTIFLQTVLSEALQCHDELLIDASRATAFLFLADARCATWPQRQRLLSRLLVFRAVGSSSSTAGTTGSSTGTRQVGPSSTASSAFFAAMQSGAETALVERSAAGVEVVAEVLAAAADAGEVDAMVASSGYRSLAAVGLLTRSSPAGEHLAVALRAMLERCGAVQLCELAAACGPDSRSHTSDDVTSSSSSGSSSNNGSSSASVDERAGDSLAVYTEATSTSEMPSSGRTPPDGGACEASWLLWRDVEARLLALSVADLSASVPAGLLAAATIGCGGTSGKVTDRLLAAVAGQGSAWQSTQQYSGTAPPPLPRSSAQAQLQPQRPSPPPATAQQPLLQPTAALRLLRLLTSEQYLHQSAEADLTGALLVSLASLEEHMYRLSPAHLVTLLQSLSRLHSVAPLLSTESTRTFARRRRRVITVGGAAGAGPDAAVAIALADVRRRAARSLSLAALRRLPTFPEIGDLTRLVVGLATLDAAPSLLLRAVTLRVIERFDEALGTELLWLLWGLAKAKVRALPARKLLKETILLYLRGRGVAAAGGTMFGSGSSDSDGSSGSGTWAAAPSGGSASGTGVRAGGLAALTSGQVAGLVWACGRLEYGTVALVVPLLRCLPAFPPSQVELHHVSQTLVACAHLRLAYRPLIAWAVNMAMTDLALVDAGTQAVANLTWALWKLGHEPSRDFLELIMSACSGRLSDFRARELSSLTFALAHWRLTPADWGVPALLEIEQRLRGQHSDTTGGTASGAASRTVESLGEAFTEEELCSVTWALAKMGHRISDETLSAVSSRLLRHIKALPHSAVPRFFWACSRCGYRPPSVLQAAYCSDLTKSLLNDVPGNPAGRGMEEGQAGLLVAAANALSAHKIKDRALLSLLERVAARRPLLFSGRQLASFLFSLAQLKHTPSHWFGLGLFRLVMELLPELKLADLTRMLWASAQWDLRALVGAARYNNFLMTAMGKVQVLVRAASRSPPSPHGIADLAAALASHGHYNDEIITILYSWVTTLPGQAGTRQAAAVASAQGSSSGQDRSAAPADISSRSATRRDALGSSAPGASDDSRGDTTAGASAGAEIERSAIASSGSLQPLSLASGADWSSGPVGSLVRRDDGIAGSSREGAETAGSSNTVLAGPSVGLTGHTGMTDGGVTSPAATDMAAALSRFSVRQLATLVWAFATFKHDVPELLDAAAGLLTGVPGRQGSGVLAVAGATLSAAVQATAQDAAPPPLISCEASSSPRATQSAFAPADAALSATAGAAIAADAAPVLVSSVPAVASPATASADANPTPLSQPFSSNSAVSGSSPDLPSQPPLPSNSGRGGPASSSTATDSDSQAASDNSHQLAWSSVDVFKLMWTWAKFNRHPGRPLLEAVLHSCIASSGASLPLPTPANSDAAIASGSGGGLATARPPQGPELPLSSSQAMLPDASTRRVSLTGIQQSAAALSTTVSGFDWALPEGFLLTDPRLKSADKPRTAAQLQPSKVHLAAPSNQAAGVPPAAPQPPVALPPMPLHHITVGLYALALMREHASPLAGLLTGLLKASNPSGAFDTHPEWARHARQLGAVLLAGRADRSPSPLEAALPPPTRQRLIEAWRDGAAARSASRPSAYILEIARTVRKLGLGARVHALTPDGCVCVDVAIALPEAIGGARFALELVGRHNTTVNSRRLLGDAALKFRLLQARGYLVVPIACHRWDELATGEQKVQYLQVKLDQRLTAAAAAVAVGKSATPQTAS